MEAAQRLLVVLARTAQREPAADEDGPVAARQRQLVHGLDKETGLQPFRLQPLAGKPDHVGRDVGAVHVEAGAAVGNEQPAGAARDVERRLTEPLDEAA